MNVGDPVAMGLVDSLPRPGRNATGFSDILADLSGKLVDLAKQVDKSQGTIDYLWHTEWPDGQNRYQKTDLAAQSLGVKLRSRGIGDNADVDEAIAAIKENGGTTLIVQPGPFTYIHRERISDSAIENRIATIFAFPIAAREGALIGYGPDYVHMYRRAPLYVDRILKGTKPADLPVQQPTKIEMIINLKTAKALALDLPVGLLIHADDLIA